MGLFLQNFCSLGERGEAGKIEAQPAAKLAAKMAEEGEGDEEEGEEGEAKPDEAKPEGEQEEKIEIMTPRTLQKRVADLIESITY